MKFNTQKPETMIDAQQWADEENRKRDPFSLDPVYIVVNPEDEKEIDHIGLDVEHYREKD